MRRWLPFLLLNALVSFLVIATVLAIWGNRIAPTLVNVPETTIVAQIPQVIAPTTAAESAQPAASAPDTTPLIETAPTATLDDAPTSHVVKQGDTIGGISLIYNVPMAAIMEANGISDPNLISVGQLLTIPQDDEVADILAAAGDPIEPTATPIPPTPTITPQPAAMAITAVTSAGELAGEALTIENGGESSADLTGWTIAASGGATYTFGQRTLFGGADLMLFTGVGVDTATQLYWGLDNPVWVSAETVTLFDQNGTAQASFTVP